MRNLQEQVANLTTTVEAFLQTGGVRRAQGGNQAPPPMGLRREQPQGFGRGVQQRIDYATSDDDEIDEEHGHRMNDPHGRRQRNLGNQPRGD